MKLPEPLDILQSEVVDVRFRHIHQILPLDFVLFEALSIFDECVTNGPDPRADLPLCPLVDGVHVYGAWNDIPVHLALVRDGHAARHRRTGAPGLTRLPVYRGGLGDLGDPFRQLLDGRWLGVSPA